MMSNELEPPETPNYLVRYCSLSDEQMRLVDWLMETWLSRAPRLKSGHYQNLVNFYGNKAIDLATEVEPMDTRPQ